MNTYSQAFAGVAVAVVFAAVAILGTSGSNPVLANFALAVYGGDDEVTICNLNETIEVDAATVAGYIAGGAHLGACSTDVGQLVISQVHLQKYSDTQDWVELYNPSNQSVDLAGWQVCNAFSCDALGSGLVAPGEYVLIAGSNSIHTEISVPWGVELVIIGDGEIGSDLMHYADVIKLRGSDGIIVDQMNWGTADTAWPNYNESTWAGLPGVFDQVLARGNVAADTNGPSDWAAGQVPSVDLETPLTKGSAVQISWTSSDSNLTADLYWFEEDDTLHLIELGTDNDGFYEWTAPTDYTGEIRVKVVLTSPNSPLLNTKALSAPFSAGEAVELVYAEAATSEL